MEETVKSSATLRSDQGVQTPIRGTCLLGRAATNNIPLPGEKVSRKHAMVHEQGDGEFWLIDLGSSNGTHLNGRRITQPCRLRDGDEVRIADYKYTFQQHKPDNSTPRDIGATEKTLQEIRTAHCWLLVADIESSTRLTKQRPDEAAQVTGQWLSACKQTVDDTGGAINKFLGDGFLAYWIAQAQRMPDIMRALNVLKAEQQKENPRFRIVLHYGKIMLGGGASMGEENLFGPEVNFVFRLEKVAGSIGHPRLISEPAKEQLGNLITPQPEGEHHLQGFEGNFKLFSF